MVFAFLKHHHLPVLGLNSSQNAAVVCGSYGCLDYDWQMCNIRVKRVQQMTIEGVQHRYTDIKAEELNPG